MRRARLPVIAERRRVAGLVTPKTRMKEKPHAP